MNELEALVALTNIPQMGPMRTRQLLQNFDSAVSAWKGSAKAIPRLPGIKRDTMESFEKNCQDDAWIQDIDLAERHQVVIIPFTSEQYPKKLREIPDAPLVLYIKGDLSACQTRSLAIVGTRECTAYGAKMARQFGEKLAQSGYVVVSGLAKGIDAIAHESAMHRGKTVAVLGFGLAHMYPQEHEELADKICHKGALVSEYPMATPPDRQRFPQRNRIVSGMSIGTLLIEAPLESGAMITMRKAYEQKRTLYVIPGQADCLNFRGNHSLLKERKARLVEAPEDLLMDFDTLFPLNI